VLFLRSAAPHTLAQLRMAAFLRCAALAALCSLAQADRLYAVVGMGEPHLESLVGSRAKVVGQHDDVAFVKAAALSALPKNMPRTQDLGAYNETDELFFVLRMSKNSSTVSIKEWAKETLRGNPEVRLVFRRAAHMLLAVGKETFVLSKDQAVDIEGDAVFNNLHLMRGTHYFPLIPGGLKPSTVKANHILRSIRDNFKRQENIAEWISQVDAAPITTFVNAISNTWNTRNSFSPQVRDAGVFLRERFVSYGFEVTMENAREDMGDNVIAEYRGSVNPDEYIVIGAHYDSRGRDSSSVTETAPGANDDGSGLAMLMELARIIHDNQMQFDYSLLMIAFMGEEQGLVGSRVVARRMAAAGETIVAMMAADMIGYRVPGREIQIGLPITYHTPVLTDLAEEIMNEYVPDMLTCEYTGCCTDNRAFYDEGFVNTRFFEACGALDDPFYHTPEDIVDREGFDIPGTLVSTTRGILATTFTLLRPLAK